jgi:hypothetical protein
VADRVITGNTVPDHVTITRFICRHERTLGALFSQVLGLSAEAGLLGSGVVSVDSTRIAANASRERNPEFGEIAMEIVEQVKATDEAEDEEFGEARGDELPEELRTPEGRREFFRRARQELNGDGGGQELGEAAEWGAETGCEYEFDEQRIVARVQGAKGGGARPIASSSASTGRVRIRSRARARSGCCWRPRGFRMTWAPSGRATRRIRRGGWPALPRTARDGWLPG